MFKFDRDHGLQIWRDEEEVGGVFIDPLRAEARRVLGESLADEVTIAWYIEDVQSSVSQTNAQN